MTSVTSLTDDSGLRVRLEAYARYAATLARQEEALAAGDLDLFKELADLRRQLQDTVDNTEPAMGSVDGSPAAREAVEEGRGHLRDAMVREARIRRTLLEMRRDTAVSLRDLETRESQVKQYAREDEVSPRPAEGRRVDIKL